MLNIKDIIQRNHIEPIEVTQIRENIKQSFRRLEFQEGPHLYFLHNDDGTTLQLPSVSHVTHKYKPFFDAEAQSKKTAIKLGKTQEEVLRMWEEINIKATNNGTSTHLFGESFMYFFMNQPELIPDVIKPQYEKGYLIPYSTKQEAILKFYEDLFVNDRIYPVMPEAQVYMGVNDNFLDVKQYAGTFDMLFTYKSNDGKWKLLLYDYKTNENLYNDYARNFNKMFLSPFNELYDESFSAYILQLSCYSLCLQQLGYEVADRKLIWLKNDGTYEAISTPDYSKQIRAALQEETPRVRQTTIFFEEPTITNITSSKQLNTRLHSAKSAKNDEFYTRFEEIDEEVIHYKEQFKDKIVLCNCNDTIQRNFYKYFSSNFHEYGIKKVIAISYTGDSGEKAVVVSFDGTNEEINFLNGNGDFRSDECLEYLKQCDIVVTNPPFSLFRDFISLVVEYDKDFLVIGNNVALGYKEIFPLIQQNKLRPGYKTSNKDSYFDIPEDVQNELIETNRSSSFKIINGKIFGRVSTIWFTSLKVIGKPFITDYTKEFSNTEYKHYQNFDAIHINKLVDIPKDYYGIIGVPITFLERCNIDDFDIIQFRKGNDGKDLCYFDETSNKVITPFTRILVKRKK